jgi:nucleoside-diphosphate-sugar epimerase
MTKVLVTGGSGFIGTNLVESLLRDGIEVLNFDCKRPLNAAHDDVHRSGNILDSAALQALVNDFKPEAIVHLAARTDLKGKTLADYEDNTTGVGNIIEAARRQSRVERVIFASSRYVHESERQPSRDDEYSPFTMYGASKVEGEKIVRASGLDCAWVLVRPTSIWGPWFDIPYKGFFAAVRKGVYVHPRGEKIYKSYGYVGNAVHQLRKFLTATREGVNGRTFYLADYEPIEIRKMADEIRTAFDARPVHDVDLPLLKMAALAGDVCKKAGWYNPPLSSFRLNNLRTQMVYDISATAEISGDLPFDMPDGVRHTVEWMKRHD